MYRTIVLVRGALLISAILLVVGSAGGTVYVVSPDGTGDFPTIQAAIDAAQSGDVIELTDGVFTGQGNHNLWYLGKQIAVRSQSGDPLTCIIDCEGILSQRGLWFGAGEGSDAILEGVTIRQGLLSASAAGAGILCCDGASPTLRDCIFAANAAGLGGGLHCEDGAAPQLIRCAFIGNSGGDGAAVACIESSPTFIDCRFESNHASRHGGAIWCFGGASPSFIACEFYGNTAERDGGALHGDFYCDSWLRSCTFRDNCADRGGALYVWLYCDPRIENCTFCNNCAYAGGAALHCFYGSDPVLDGCILAFASLGEAFVCDNSETACEPQLSCCDIFGNEGGDWTGCIDDQYGLDGNISADPLFCDAGSGNFRLQPDSPCAPFTPPNPECDLIGAWGVGCDPMNIPGREISGRVQLSSPVPNPFGVATRIEYRLSDRGAATLRLDVLDATGRCVRSLAEGPLSSGCHSLNWDGTGHNGERLPSGIYLLRMEADGAACSRRLVLMR